MGAKKGVLYIIKMEKGKKQKKGLANKIIDSLSKAAGFIGPAIILANPIAGGIITGTGVVGSIVNQFVKSKIEKDIEGIQRDISEVNIIAKEINKRLNSILQLNYILLVLLVFTVTKLYSDDIASFFDWLEKWLIPSLVFGFIIVALIYYSIPSERKIVPTTPSYIGKYRNPNDLWISGYHDNRYGRRRYFERNTRIRHRF